MSALAQDEDVIDHFKPPFLTDTQHHRPNTELLNKVIDIKAHELECILFCTYGHTDYSISLYI